MEQLPLPDQTFVAQVKAEIDAVIEAAQAAIDADPQRCFTYSCPRRYLMQNTSHADQTTTTATSPMLWPRIGCFTARAMIQSIRKFIELWNIDSLYSVIIEPMHEEVVPNMGRCYHVKAKFSRLPDEHLPMDMRVFFHVYVSQLLPKYYPIMVTYTFEGEQKVYYALGASCDGSLTFQRRIIDFVMGKKYILLAEKRVGDTI